MYQLEIHPRFRGPAIEEHEQVSQIQPSTRIVIAGKSRKVEKSSYSMLMSALLLGLVFRVVHFFEKRFSFRHSVDFV
jgi:hypothetical protein